MPKSEQGVLLPGGYKKLRFSTLIDSDKENYLKKEFQKEKLSSLKLDRWLRLIFSFVVLIGVGVYIGFIINIIYKCGHVCNLFQLSDTVIITLLSTTTANIVGLLAFVVRYLFPQKKEKE